jgi:hypothetical protein
MFLVENVSECGIDRASDRVLSFLVVAEPHVSSCNLRLRRSAGALEDFRLEVTRVDDYGQPQGPPTTIMCANPECPLRVAPGLYRLVSEELAMLRRIRGGMTFNDTLFEPEPRQPDARPTAGPGSGVPGVGRVGLGIDTGGDQMGRMREVGLFAFAEWETGSLSQMVASCAGGAGMEPDRPDVAGCDRRSIELVLRSGEMRILDGEVLLASIRLPEGVEFAIATLDPAQEQGTEGQRAGVRRPRGAREGVHEDRASGARGSRPSR